MKKIAIYILLIFNLFISVSSAKNYYVSKSSGSDNNNGLSLSSPFRSIRRVAKVVLAGDTVYIREGRYTGKIKIEVNGTPDKPIIFKNYENETVKLIGDTKTGGPTLRIVGNYITIDGLHSKLYNPCQGKHNNQFNFEITGDHVTIQHCHFDGTDSVKDWSPPCNGREGGVLVSGGDYASIYKNEFSELSFQAIKFLDQGKNVSSFWHVKENKTNKIHSNGVFIESQQSKMQHGLIEDNEFIGSIVSDGVQSNGIYEKGAEPTNYGVIIQNNIIIGNAENGIDLKGTRYYVVQNNILQGNIGDNDGFQDQIHDAKGGAALNVGSNARAEDNIYRGNLIFDNHAGISPAFRGYRVYNNTVINNNRDYTGSNSKNLPKIFIGLSASWMDDIKFMNNIIGNHGGCEVSIDPTKSSNYIDYNFYINDPASPPVFCSWIEGEQIKYSFESWKKYLSLQPIEGKEIHSHIGDPDFLNANSNIDNLSKNFTFELSPVSPIIGKGGPLTITTESGDNSSALKVEDGKYFTDGMNIIDGDTIMVGSDVVQVKRKEGNILYLDQEISWDKNSKVIWCPNHECPENGLIDIGATQYKKQKS
ncbi:MAG: hypothetical protein PVI90_12225 [Desulfobacteraceae bacterium]